MRLSVLCVVTIAVLSCVWTTAQSQDEELTRYEYHDVLGIKRENDLEQTPRIRKRRFLDKIVGFLGGLFGGGVQRSDAEAAARNYDAQMKIKLQELCLSICVTEWNPWLRCSQQCGGGIQNRTRETNIIGQCVTLENFECPYPLSQSQSCNEDCPNGGSPDASKRGCKCPDGKEGRCCEIEINCPYPRKNPSSKIQGSTWPAVFQSVVTYTCNEGFTLVGVELRTCDKDGKWSGTPPTCKRVKCAMPVKNNHVEIMNPDETGYNFNDEIIYGCEAGYEMRGPERRVCRRFEGENGKWSGFDPTCRPVSCGEPSLPDNAERSGTDFNFGGVVTYECNLGYHLSGSKRLRCGASGRWIGRAPECEDVTQRQTTDK